MQEERATNLGEIINQERTRGNVPQTGVFRGICSQGNLSKLENGEIIPDKLLVDASLQRLGRCSDTLEAIMSKNEYMMFEIREAIKGQYYSKDYEKVRELLKEYRGRKKAREPIHAQFIGMYEALNEYNFQKDVQKCREKLGKALEITFPEWKKCDFIQRRLCSQELHLIILIAFFLLDGADTGQANEAEGQRNESGVDVECLLRQAAGNFEANYCEEEKAKYFPQCMWLLAMYWERRGEWRKAEEYGSRGLDCSAKRGALPLLAKLLELVIKSRDHLFGEWDGRQEMCRQLEVLAEVLRTYGAWVLSLDHLELLQFICHEDDVSLDFETLRDIRKNCGIIQGALESCTQPTFSRIECGRQSPSPKHFMEIAKEMGVEKAYYGSRVMSSDYDLYELAHQRNQACFNQEWEKEQELLDKLEASLDMDIPVNRQYIETCRLEERKHQGEITPEEGIRELEKILRYTMSDYRDGKLRVPSRQEFVILNLMAGFMHKSGQMESALELRARILEVLQKSAVREEYHTNTMLLLYKSYGELLEVANQLDLAEEMDRRGIQLAIRCGQVDIIGKILANLACVYQKMKSPAKQELSKRCFKNAYWLCHLMERHNLAQVIAVYYESAFKEKISV